MSKKVEITINGVAYPCRPTMGAMLRFKKETGREVTEIKPDSFTDLCTYLWCCIVSASKADGLKFDFSLMDFADCISQDDMLDWAQSVSDEAPADDAGAEAGEEKKSK